MSAALDELIRTVTTPVSWMYGWAVAVRNRRFDKGRRVQRVDRPVISVGNITTGGVGKSPMVSWIASFLRAQGHTPVIAMRGYMARAGAMSDEEAEYHDRLDDVQVLAKPDRLTALNEFLPEHPEVECVLLDDGFQHRFVHRDLDLVLIDAMRNTLNDELLPKGRLREPLANLARADAVIITHAHDTDDLIAAKVQGLHGHEPIAWSDHTWSHLRVYEADESERLVEVQWLRGKKVVTLLGVGHPKAIIAQLEQAGAKVLANVPAGDHEAYDRAKLNVAMGLCHGAQALVMTGKDWVKARELIEWSRWPVPIVVPHLEINVFEGAVTLQDLICRTIDEHDRRDLDLPRSSSGPA